MAITKEQCLELLGGHCWTGTWEYTCGAVTSNLSQDPRTCRHCGLHQTAVAHVEWRDAEPAATSGGKAN